MVYVMSDLHGQYQKYREMLRQIHFSDTDELYVLGDVVDRGSNPIRILQDMSLRPNVFPILGNHDYIAECMLRNLNVEITRKNFETHLSMNLLKGLQLWLSDGGNTTLEEFRKLPLDAREDILEYFSEFAPYEELTVGENRFVLVHGGLPNFNAAKALSEYNEIEVISERPDYTKRYFPDRYLVTGHTPTLLIDKEYDGRIYRANGHIAIDCGAGFGNRLGCIRLDDFAEFYI